MSSLCPRDGKSVMGTNSATKATSLSGVNIVKFVNKVSLASPKGSGDRTLPVNALISRRSQRDPKDQVRHYVTTREAIAMGASPGPVLLCHLMHFKRRTEDA